MKNKSILTLAAIMMMASAVFAGPGCGNGHMGGPQQGDGPQMGASQCTGNCHGKNADPMEELGLTSEQKQQIEEIQDATRLAMIDLEAAAEKAQLAMHTAIKDGESLNVINKKIDALTQTRGEILKKRVATHAAVREVLTPEQREKFDDLAPMWLEGGKGRGMSESNGGGEHHRNERGQGRCR